MAEGVVHLENDLKRILGISVTNADTHSSTESAPKLCNSPSRGPHTSEATNAAPKKQSKKLNKKKENRKFQGNQDGEGCPLHNNAVSSASNMEGNGKLKEDALTKRDHNSKEENKSVDKSLSSRQHVSDQPHYFKFDGYKKPKSGSQNSSKVFSRSAASNNSEFPQNWRQPAREAVLKGKSLVVGDHASKSLAENGTKANREGTERDSLEPEKEFRKKTRVRTRARKEKKESGEINRIAANVISETVVVPRHLMETNDSPTAGPSAIQKNDSTIVPKEENQQPVATKAAIRQEQVPIDSQDGKEMVSITIPPQPPKQKRQKKAKGEKSTEKSDPEKKEEEDDSSSSDSSSSEEEKTPRPEREILPLVFTIPKDELDSFRRRGVLPLKHISPKFPRAIFHCRLCSFHISSIPEVYRHMKDERHARLQNQERSRQTAALMPLPTLEIMEGVGQFILSIYQCSGLTKEALEIRCAEIDILRTMIEIAFPGFTIRPYGSFFTGLFTFLVQIILIF